MRRGRILGLADVADPPRIVRLDGDESAVVSVPIHDPAGPYAVTMTAFIPTNVANPIRLAYPESSATFCPSMMNRHTHPVVALSRSSHG